MLVPISEQGVQPSIGSLPPVVSNIQQKTPSKTSAIPSDLNALRKAVNEPKEETQTTTEKTALRNNSYTPEAVQKAWDEFAGKSTLQQLDQEVLKSSCHLEKDTITVSIPNQALMSNFEKLRSGLLAHLRNALDNDQLNMEAKVVEVSQEKMRYTDQEKFNYLKEKYPVLKELQEKLGLEPDF